MTSLFDVSDTETDYVKGKYGTNQKKSGDVLENLVYDLLREKYNNAIIKKQYNIFGSYVKSAATGKLRKKRYKVDIFFNNDTIISIKNQNTGGTAEQKIMHEQHCIEDMFENNPNLKRAFIVYKGKGFKVFDEEYEYIPSFKRSREQFSWIKIVSYDEFIENI
jgi:hypothetical protein